MCVRVFDTPTAGAGAGLSLVIEFGPISFLSVSRNKIRSNATAVNY